MTKRRLVHLVSKVAIIVLFVIAYVAMLIKNLCNYSFGQTFIFISACLILICACLVVTYCTRNDDKIDI